MSAGLPHLIFDLDGTLVDSATALVDIVNEMLTERGSERVVTVGDARPFLSLGGEALVSGLLGEECGDADAELADFRRRYASRATSNESLFEGVRAGLQDLAEHGFTLAICSNKPEHLCEKVLTDVSLAHLFTVIVGSAPGRQLKPAPDLMQVALERLESQPSRAILIGDSEVDHALAERTGVPFLFVDYGNATDGWDSSGLDQFSTFSDVVGWLKSQYSTAAPRRGIA